MTIRNNGTETVQLIAVSASLPQLWIHRTAVTDAIENILPVEISKLYPETQSRLNHAALT